MTEIKDRNQMVEVLTTIMSYLEREDSADMRKAIIRTSLGAMIAYIIEPKEDK